MLLSSRNLSWLNPVPGTELYSRQKLGAQLAFLLFVLELSFVSFGAFQCKTIPHWILFGGVTLLLILIFAAAIFPQQKKPQLEKECDIYHELFLFGSLLVMSQLSFILAAISVIRGYSWLLSDGDGLTLLAAIDWFFAILAMFIFVLACCAYILMSTREVPKSEVN